MTDKKTLWYLVIAVVAIIIIGGGLWWYLQSQNINLSMFTSGNYNNSSTTTTNNNATGKLSYAAALKLYSTRRIQFDQKCLLVPNNVTYKTGTTVMFDNRSSKANVIALDNVNYNIGAYNYVLVTLTTGFALPHTISVDCGRGENQGRILLQK